MEFTTTDGVRLHYTDQGRGPVVVLLAGIGSFSVVWQPTIDFLLQQNYRVLTLDARNQGLSEHTAQGLRISRHAMDVAELLAFLDIANFIGIGHSMGAATWWAYASLFGTRQMQALIDIDQSPKMINDARWPYGFKNLTQNNFFTLLQAPFGRATVQNLPDSVYYQNRALQASHPYDPELNYPFLLDHALQDWRDVIIHLQCPFLVVNGGQSPFFAPRFGPVVAALAPKGHHCMIEHSGHLPMTECPQAFQRQLQQFLRQLK
ncbi:MAG: alpha/beta hydrolase [Bombilactobacillus mellifer]|uniref:alpha/beta fold hydrolase n=1 Tax=Bombilactobacillus mellifer TaxID=1218492 RepID=UPI0023F9D05F|nr:alpha/beta hydrolase [Bombilactobacillus mellifer]MCT6894643.1 alpha/beta hydrolase [Bombilactobacillus mellifer]